MLFECDESEAAERVKELIRTLERMGTVDLIGRIEGYRIKMTSRGNPQVLELRIADENG